MDVHSLPPELWDIVTKHLDCLSVTWLHRTCKRIAFLLENGGVTCWYHPGLHSRSFRAWPGSWCNKLQRLQYLRLCASEDHKMTQTEARIEHLLDLPRSLLSLAIHTSNRANQLHVEAFPRGLTKLSWNLAKHTTISGAMMASLPVTLKRLELAEDTTTTVTIETDAELQMPRGLEYLRLRRVRFSWGKLPEGLLGLELPSHGGVLTPDEVGPLPRSLTSLLALDTYLAEERALDSLPPNLTELEISPWLSQGWTDHFLAHLPPRLTHFASGKGQMCTLWYLYYLGTVLNLNYTTLPLPERPFNQSPRTRFVPKKDRANQLALFPTAIQMLRPSTLSIVCATVLPENCHFPPSLTSLTMTCWAYQQNRNPSDNFACLPQTLTYFCFADILSAASASNLPRGLLTLIIAPEGNPEGPHLSDMAAGESYKFPPNLTHFEDHSKAYPAGISLPKSLTKLIVPRYKRFAIEISAWLGSCKDSPSSPIISPWLHLDITSDVHLSDENLLLLNPSMLSLSLSWNSRISPTGMQNLPRHLTVLNLLWSNSVIDSSVRHLPRTLLELNIDCSSHLTSEGLAHLPPSLTILNWSRGYLLDKHGAALLPRSLTYLCLKEAPNLPSDIFAALPAGLTTLNLRSMKTLLDGSHLADLPRSLTDLDLHANKSISGEHLQLLPRLSRLDIFSAVVKSSDLWKLVPLPEELVLSREVSSHPHTLLLWDRFNQGIANKSAM